ncbi:MAG: hypothetical protein O3C68_07890 [Proteobacteria bacterium]|nr:hypothetical protein [Pseudomonadota bacterium]
MKRVLALGASRIGQHQYARVLLQKEDYNSALIEFRALISQDSEDGDAYKGLITAFELLKEADKGVAEVASHVESSGAMTAALVLSEYYGRNGDLSQSEEWFDKYKGPVSPLSTQLSESLIISKARAKQADGELESSFTILADGLTRHPESTRILTSLITLKIREDKFVEAESYLEQLSAIGEESMVPLLRGDLEAAKGNFLAAREAYTEAWQQAPADRTAFKLFSVLQSGDRTPEEIVAFMDEWVERLPESSIAATTRAGFLFSVGNFEQAQVGHEAEIERNPENAVALNNLAWIYGEEQLDQALASSKAAYELAGSRPEIIDS